MAENHEIFDNARVTELALKWKALTKENKHGEAMPVLEEIIRLCEHMFLRLAQYEGFTNTVDLSTLVQSAREKVPRWLIGWDPTYKSNNGIFSWFSKCSKHAFLSEIAKLNQHRKRFHATGDNLEKFFGAEDHNAFKEEAASDVRRKLADITVRWGDPQEIGVVRYILECLVEDRDADSKPDKEVVIRSASYAWCVSPELTRFFYDWALFALRDALHHKIHVPFTQQDLLRNRESYTFLVDMIDIVGWDRFKRLIVTLGGQRLRLPTLQQLARLHADYLMSQEIDKSDLDPDSVEQVGKKHGRSAKAAAEIYAEMVEITNPRRSGEHSLYPDPSEEHHDSDN